MAPKWPEATTAESTTEVAKGQATVAATQAENTQVDTFRTEATSTAQAETVQKKSEVQWTTTDELKSLQQEFQTTQRSEKINMMQHSNALKDNPKYQEQVRNILRWKYEQSTDGAELKKGIKELQKALKVKDDGALGPNTFQKLKARWDSRPSGQDYQTFIDGLMNRSPAAHTEPHIEPNLETTTAPIEPVKNGDTSPVVEKVKEKDQIVLADYTFELEWSLMTLGIERNAKILPQKWDVADQTQDVITKVWDEILLDINAMGKHVTLQKEDLQSAIKNGMSTVEGKVEWSGKPVNIVINKRINEKTPFDYDQKWLEKGIISQGNVNYSFELKKWDLKHFGTDPDVSSITVTDQIITLISKNEKQILSREKFEKAVTAMNQDGKSTIEYGNNIIINKEKGEWKKPKAETTTSDATSTKYDTVA